MKLSPRLLALPTAVAMAASVLAAGQPDTTHQHRAHADKFTTASASAMVPDQRLVDVPCVDGKADVFPCDNLDLLSFVPMDEFYEEAADHVPAPLSIGQTRKLSEIWGWANPETGNEFVVVGMFNAVAFFDVTNPYDPRYLGKIESATPQDMVWFDVKTYQNHALITAEATPFGMLVFDLTRLEDVTEPEVFQPDGVYAPNVTAHNVVVNEDSGYAYLVGSGTLAGALTSGLNPGAVPYNSTVAAEPCRGGLHAVNLAVPTVPVFGGCFATDGYVHDAQCVIYDGPDTDYTGREICVAFNEDDVFIVDMTDKVAILEVSRFTYDDAHYTHQGWLTEDHRHLLFNDEGDEDAGKNTTTYVADLSDLDNPVFVGEYDHGTTSIDHNNYVHDGLAFQSNYTTGLRVLDLDGIATAELETIAYFDTFPDHDRPVFLGTWGNYPWLPSGNIVISGGSEGLFIVRLAPEAGGNKPGPDSPACTKRPEQSQGKPRFCDA